MRGAPCSAAAPVAKASRVSEVEVSPSIVTALKLSATPSASRRCSAGAAIGASVNTKASMVAMSGAIMPAPLAIPQMVTVALPSFAVAVAPLGNVSVVMIAFAAASHEPGLRIGDEAVHHAGEGAGIERLADHAGRGEEYLAPACTPPPWPAMSAVSLVASRPLRPVKALALPELTTSARALPPLSLARHQSTGADGHFDRVKTPATVRAGIEQHHQHVGAVLVADAGCGGREPHAGDLGHVGKIGRCERRDRCHGAPPEAFIRPRKGHAPRREHDHRNGVVYFFGARQAPPVSAPAG